MIDLHIHTDASSDGEPSPREIFEMARGKGLRAIAFADHNSIGHVAEGLALAEEFRVEFIPCLELNTFHNGRDLHLLAYFIDPENRKLRDWLKIIREKKIEQAEKRLRNFAVTHGLVITAGSDFHGTAIKPDVDLGQGGDNHYDLLVKLKTWWKDRQ